MEEIRYYKGERPCKIVFRPKGHNKQIIEFLDDQTQCITLVRLCWRNQKDLNNRIVSGIQK